ncbi:MAG TPA: septum formation initiator family protein [Actinomycetota bacterium]|nr:septum formation initiator family protein [Actinomycetota bacterium]
MTTTAARGPRGRVGIAPRVAVIALLLGLVAAMAVEPTRQLFEQRRRVDDMRGELRAVTVANRRLEARIQRLEDPDYIEQRAREQAGLVLPGETTFVVMPPSRADVRAERDRRARPAPEPPRPEPEPGLLEGFLRFVGL